jgi:hypothetical protein
MTSEPAPPVQSSSRRRAWLAAALALAAFAVAVGISLRTQAPPARPLSLTAGDPGTTRELVARALAAELRERGIPIEVVPAPDIHREIADLDSGRIDFALISGAVRATRPLRIRELTPLFPEALHLLVKEEIAERVRGSLGELRGLRVDLGPPDSPTALLAAEILEFAGIACALDAKPGGCRTSQLEIAQLERGIGSADRAALPDAVFHLAAVPSLVALRLVREQRYELVPLPFAEAFRLDAILAEEDVGPSELALARRFTRKTVIPAYAYRDEPPVPPGPIPPWARVSYSLPTRTFPPRRWNGYSRWCSSPASRTCRSPRFRRRCSRSPRGSRCTRGRGPSWRGPNRSFPRATWTSSPTR